MPFAERVLYESGPPVSAATGSGPGGRVLKEDAMKAVAAAKPSPAAVPAVASQIHPWAGHGTAKDESDAAHHCLSLGGSSANRCFADHLQ